MSHDVVRKQHEDRIKRLLKPESAFIVLTFSSKAEALSAVDRLIAAGLQLYEFNETVFFVNSIGDDGYFEDGRLVTVFDESGMPCEELRKRIDAALHVEAQAA